MGWALTPKTAELLYKTQLETEGYFFPLEDVFTTGETMSRKRAYVAYISLSALNHFNQSISGLLAQKAGVSFVELNP